MAKTSQTILGVTAAQRKRWLSCLKTVTALPTAAGHEQAVAHWIETWANDPKNPHDAWTCRADEHGNLIVENSQAASTPGVFLTAHMDHPAFVVDPSDQPESGKHQRLVARFMGGVQASYFVDTPVRVWTLKPDGTGYAKGPVGVVVSHQPGQGDRWWPVCEIDLEKPIEVGDTPMLLTWELPKAEVVDGHFHTPVCDDLAGLVAAICAAEWAVAMDPTCDIRLLFTRAEEVGFLGAIAAAQTKGNLPKGAKLVCLETSKALPHAPIGDGPIVRVGDKTGTFDKDLTFAVSQIAQQLQDADESFAYQRKLMDGGTCEATAFCALGHIATCCCLPLGQYHNMHEASGTIRREEIALSDFEGLVRLLTAIALKQADPTRVLSINQQTLPKAADPNAVHLPPAANLKQRMRFLLKQRQSILAPRK